MERLTRYCATQDGEPFAVPVAGAEFQDYMMKLAAYEDTGSPQEFRAYKDTGLTPEEIKSGINDAADLARIAIALRKLRRYEYAEQSGRNVVLPCKVGDTVYVPDYDAVREVHVEAISITETHTFICCTFSCSGWGCPCVFEHFAYTGEEYDCNNYGYIEIPVEEVGKTWFTTREEAEKALKGVSEDA